MKLKAPSPPTTHPPTPPHPIPILSAVSPLPHDPPTPPPHPPVPQRHSNKFNDEISKKIVIFEKIAHPRDFFEDDNFFGYFNS